MKATKGRLRLCACLTGCLLVFIWGNSLLPAEVSQAFSDWVKALLTSASPETGGSGSGLLRKFAHFAEFAALGMSLGWLFGMLGKRWIYPILSGFGVACVDETIQMFVPDRGPGLPDVALDTAGVAAGICVLYFGYKLGKKIINHKQLEEKSK